MPDEQRTLTHRTLVKPISDNEAADLIRKVQTAIKIRNALSSSSVSDEQFALEMRKVLQLVIPTAARITVPFTHLIAGGKMAIARKMAIAATAGEKVSLKEILATLREPERHDRFYPETMRAGSRAMIRLTESFWPENVAHILYAALGDLDDGRLPKMLTPAPRKIGKGSFPDRKRFALWLACEVEFQKSTSGLSDERAVHRVTGQTRAGFDAESLPLPPPIPLPSLSWDNITNRKKGILAFARKHFPEEIAEAAGAGQMVAAGEMDRFRSTEFASFRARYLQFTPEAWAAIWARAAGKDPKAAARKVRDSRSRKA